MILFSVKRRSRRRDEDGYVLITMLLMVSLMTIAALAVLPSFIFELKRDQEQEMIHRGVQYTRAVRAYYKKFGRYPTRLEDLDNTNNLRYLRKHYKDPLTGQEFKLLHFGEPGLSLGGSFGGGVIPGANPVGAQTGANGAGGSAFGGGASSAFGGGSSSFGGSGSNFGGNSSFGNSGGFGNSGVNSSGVFSQSSSLGGSSTGASSAGGLGGSSSSQTGTGQQSGSAAPDSSSTDSSNRVAPGSAQGDTSSSGQQVIASGPIVGVASVSKKTTIREFNHKRKYNEWQFIYDPTLDRGGLITTPYQPALQGFASAQNVNAQPGSSTSPNGGSTGSSFGGSFGNSFGQPTGNNSNSFGGQTTPAQPPSTTPQQQ